MKKSLIFVLFLFLLIFSLMSVCAQNQDKDIQEAKKQAENLLEKEIIIPHWFQPIAKYVFGIKESIPLQQLIILLGAWIALFILIFDILNLVFFERPAIKFLATLVIITLVSMTGAVNKIAVLFLDIAGFFEFTAKYQPLKIIIAVIIAGLIVYGALYIINQLNKKLILTRAEKVGEDFAKAGGMAGAFKEAWRKLKE